MNKNDFTVFMFKFLICYKLFCSCFASRTTTSPICPRFSPSCTSLCPTSRWKCTRKWSATTMWRPQTTWNWSVGTRSKWKWPAETMLIKTSLNQIPFSTQLFTLFFDPEVKLCLSQWQKLYDLAKWCKLPWWQFNLCILGSFLLVFIYITFLWYLSTVH